MAKLPVEIIIAKGRNYSLGFVEMIFNKAQFEFIEKQIDYSGMFDEKKTEYFHN
jgi:hypothetical protein